MKEYINKKDIKVTKNIYRTKKSRPDEIIVTVQVDHSSLSKKLKMFKFHL